MYKMILIDDEDEVREGIKRKTDWHACGFDLIGDFDNGRDALDAMETLAPDAVITDICMPFMDGLELAGHIAERYPDVLVVIVTGYEQFEYAKQAIRLKVHDYLLKPINSEEFNGFLHRMKLELDEKRRQKEDLTLLRHQLNQSLPLLRERFLERLVTSSMKPEERERKFQFFQLRLSGSHYLALVAEVDDFTREGIELTEGTDAELLRFAAFNIIQEIFEQDHQGLVFRTRDDKFAIVFSGEPESLETRAQLLAEQAKYSTAKYLNLSVTLGIGTLTSSLEQISTSFQKALSALDYRFLLGRNQIISINDMEFGKVMDHAGYLEWEKQVLSAVKSGKSRQVTHVLEGWMEELKGSSCSVEQCLGWFHRLLVSLGNLVQEMGFDSAELLGPHPVSRLSGMKTLDEVKRWLETTCHCMLVSFSEKREHVAESQIRKAIAFIHENYPDEQLSLPQVCQHIYMSISYFSAMFKQHTGVTFIEYVTRYRMGKAKELLAVTQYKTYDVAARVGYGDPQYFSIIFKRHTGMTPKEYRMTAREGSGGHEA
ncbi:helix-turn-helix domain-containing protein [Paenibacillus rigui]|uniref:DNA-binding response regulator n=1 Tax=Paenibacillus rigui TaxID=554312 RepID=A0A229URY8_9BACL|nr:helix-turn-helix domain-containing protein [Paenibacillus rigui]OXM86188.1 DNA-binding response regulator [Paenibacillus rigui]